MQNPEIIPSHKKEGASYPYIDLHCDTIAAIAGDAEGKTLLRRNQLHIDLERMKQGGAMAQVFAFFVHLGSCEKRGETPYDNAIRLCDTLDRELKANADLIRPACSASEILKNFSEGYLSAVRSVEEGAVYMDDPEKLKTLYERGVRMSTLTWNYENGLAWPNSRKEITGPDGKTIFDYDAARGLKPLGRDFVRLMEELGMIIDVSHLNDGGIRDILNTVRSSTPIIASHSNARSIASHARNLPDELLKGIADHGGVTGINFFHLFLSDHRNDTELSAIEDMVAQIRYIRNLAGIDVIALGSDFDGIGSKLELKGCGEMQKLADALSCNGFTTDEIEKIFCRNALRVFQAVLG